MDDLFTGVRAVLFDLDGTLVETNIDFALMRTDLIALARKHGIPEHEVAGLDLLAIVDYTTDRLADGSSAEYVRAEAFRKLEEIELRQIDDAQEVPAAGELVRYLRGAGIGVGIVTRNCRRAVNIVLEKTGILPDVLLTRDDVRNAKPHPDHVLEALRILEVEPSEAVMVGDHWMDVRGGKAAGTRTVGLLRPDRPADFFAEHQPDLVVRGLAELLARFERFSR